MTRPTSEIVADLRLKSLDSIIAQAGSVALRQFVTDAADRLAELEEVNARLVEARDMLMESLDLRCEHLAALDALRPTCPTCGGSTDVLKPHPTDPHWELADNCPDCSDGKVSIERLARVFEEIERLARVFEEIERLHAEGNAVAGLAHLRGIR